MHCKTIALKHFLHDSNDAVRGSLPRHTHTSIRIFLQLNGTAFHSKPRAFSHRPGDIRGKEKVKDVKPAYVYLAVTRAGPSSRCA